MSRRPVDLGSCIVTTPSVGEEGYARCNVKRFGRVIRRRHILAWVEANGRLPSPETPLILHHCDNRSCINPEHLYEGTHKDNSRDMRERGRFWNSQKTHCPQGHEYTAENTYRDSGGRGCRECRRVQDRERRRAAVIAAGKTPMLHSRYRTHCPRGHEYTEENTRFHSVSGSRRCIACDREQSKRWKRQRKAKLRAAAA